MRCDFDSIDGTYTNVTHSILGFGGHSRHKATPGRRHWRKPPSSFTLDVIDPWICFLRITKRKSYYYFFINGLETRFARNEVRRVMALDLDQVCTANMPEIWRAQNEEIRVLRSTYVISMQFVRSKYDLGEPKKIVHSSSTYRLYSHQNGA